MENSNVTSNVTLNETGRAKVDILYMLVFITSFVKFRKEIFFGIKYLTHNHTNNDG